MSEHMAEKDRFCREWVESSAITDAGTIEAREQCGWPRPCPRHVAGPCRCAECRDVTDRFTQHDLDLVAAGTSSPGIECGCYACIGHKPTGISFLTVGMTMLIVCATCGNKRCPHGTDHRLDCTGSNEGSQPGSRYQCRPLPPG